MWINIDDQKMHLNIERHSLADDIKFEMYGDTNIPHLPVTENEWEAEALKLGVPIAIAKKLRQQERESALKISRENFQKCNSWMWESFEVKRTYPQFDILEELKNEKFKELIQHIDMQTAYEILHKDELFISINTTTEVHDSTVQEEKSEQPHRSDKLIEFQ